jgi:hypothetical protein
MLNQKSIFLCLARKRISAIVICQDLFTTLGVDGASYPRVTCILRETLFRHKYFPAQEPVVERDPSAVDSMITQTLNEEPFTPVRKLAQSHVFRKVQRTPTW